MLKEDCILLPESNNFSIINKVAVRLLCILLMVQKARYKDDRKHQIYLHMCKEKMHTLLGGCFAQNMSSK